MYARRRATLRQIMCVTRRPSIPILEQLPGFNVRLLRTVHSPIEEEQELQGLISRDVKCPRFE